jgi:CRP-like cAMP-binding protein
VLPFSRNDIADCLGLTIETVSRNFTKFRVNGMIRLFDSQMVEICDPDALERLAEAE